MTRSDDQLLGQLRQALVDPDLAPGPGELARLHQALAASRSAPHRLVADEGSRPRFAGRRSPRLVVAGAMVVAALGAFAGGVAANSLPGPLRSAAYDMGLPVSSPALVAAEAAEMQLRAALVDRSRGDVLEASAVLRQRLGALAGSDRRKAYPAGAKLLAEAVSFLAAESPGSQPPSTESPTIPPETTTPEGSQGGGSSEPSTTEPSDGGSTDSGQNGNTSTQESASTTTTAPTGDSASGTGGDSTTGGQSASPGTDTSGTSGDTSSGQSSGDTTTTSTDN